MKFIFSLMNEADAHVIQTWRYEDMYAIYNMGHDNSSDPESLAELLDQRSPYYVVRNEQGELIGFFNFGTSALVWGSKEPGIYDENRTMAVGLGMRPDLTGRGLGLAFVQAGLDFARQEYAPEHFRLYVFSWNERAICVYERAGFQRVRTFLQRSIHSEREFVEMSKDA